MSKYRRCRRRVWNAELLEARTVLSAAPVAMPDVYTAPADVAIDRLAPGWLANDTDADGDTLRVANVATPQHGTVIWQPEGTWSYQANSGYVGLDRFQYQATDGSSLSQPVDVRVRVGQYAQRILADSPLGYWRLDESSSHLPATDSSGHGLDGSYESAMPGRPGAILAESGTAAQFAAGNTHVYLGGPAALLKLQNNLTIEAWVKPTSLSSLGRIFVNAQNDIDRGIGFGLYEDKLIFTAFGIKDYISQPVFDAAGQWYHVAVVFDSGNDASFFVNGKLVDQVSGTQLPRAGRHAALLGSKSGSDEQFRGVMDEVAIYDHTLTAQQIAEHYEMGTVNSGHVPVATDDEYEVVRDGSLQVDVGRVTTPRYSFEEKFDGESLSDNLIDPTDSFYTTNGRLHTAEDRQYLRTAKRDYINSDFRLEVDVDLSTTDSIIQFIGIGSGRREPAYNEPAEAVVLRFHSVGFGGDLSLSAAGPFGGVTFGKITAPGYHRVRMTKSGNELKVDVDAQFDGIFKADFSYQVDDLAKLAPFLGASNSHLILGGSPLATFDNLRVESSFDPLITTGVLANDRDPDSLPSLTARLIDTPQHGRLQLAIDGTFVYTPNAGYVGPDSFTYRADDGVNLSNLATVKVDVFSPAPQVHDDGYTTLEDTPLVINDPNLGWLANDRDRSEAELRVSTVTNPRLGTLDWRDDGTFTYQPSADVFGADEFTYVVTNGTESSQVARVSILIGAVNDPPHVADDRFVLNSDRSILVPADAGLLSNDSDVDGELGALTVSLRQAPQWGELLLQPDGSFRYTAGPNFVLTDQFTYVVDDGWGIPSSPATVVLALDAPTIRVSNASLLANTPGQQLEIWVTGGQPVSGIDVFVQLGDGGPELVNLGLPAGVRGPRLTAVDLKSGTIFQDIPDQAIDLGSLPQLANWTIATVDGADVAAEGLLATLTIDTTGFFAGQWDVRMSGILPTHPLGPFDTTFARGPAFVVDGQIRITPAEVKSRHVFYNNSRWDGDNPQADALDDAAIAVDKQALLPGQAASFVNYTSYNKGINGVIVDIAGLPDAKSLTAQDLGFRVGRSSDLASWTSAPSPQLTVRPGAGVDGSDRLTFIWPDGVIEQQWLEVTLPAGAKTYLAKDDKFYFGNAIGEVGNAVGSTLVTSIDVVSVHDHQRGPFSLAALTDVFDFNRDQIVSSVDVIIARDHQVGPLTALPLITPPVVQPAAGRAVWALPGDSNRDGVFDSLDLIEVFQAGKYEDAMAHHTTWTEGDWNGDGRFDSADLILALQFGYDAIPRNQVPRNQD